MKVAAIVYSKMIYRHSSIVFVNNQEIHEEANQVMCRRLGGIRFIYDTDSDYQIFYVISYESC